MIQSKTQNIKIHEIPFVLISREIEGLEEDLVIAANKQSINDLMDYLVLLDHTIFSLFPDQLMSQM